MGNRTVAFGTTNMKRFVAWGLVLLLANVVFEALMILALTFLFGRGDPILAAVPGILALLGIVAQPWWLLALALVVFPFGWVAAPLLATWITLGVYGPLDRQGSLDGVKVWLWRRQNPRSILRGAVLLGGLVVVGVARWHDIPPMRHDVPYAVQSELSGLRLHPTCSRWYQIRAFMDTEWLWQAHLSEERFRALGEKLKMHEIDVAEVAPEFAHQPPYWWRPELSDRTVALSTGDFPATGYGGHSRSFLATWDPEGQVMHVWFKYLFD